MTVLLRDKRVLLGAAFGLLAACAWGFLCTPARGPERKVPARLPSKLALHRELEALTGKSVVLLPEAPPYHAGMFMMPVGDRRVLVSDPALGRPLWEADQSAGPDAPPLIAQPDFSPRTQALFDAVAATCAEAGFAVTRIPTVMDENGRTFLTYVNVIIDERNGVRTVYTPVFDGADTLNDAAESVWRGLGCMVWRVDCSQTYRHFGSLRCLVNVLRRR